MTNKKCNINSSFTCNNMLITIIKSDVESSLVTTVLLFKTKILSQDNFVHHCFVSCSIIWLVNAFSDAKEALHFLH